MERTDPTAPGGLAAPAPTAGTGVPAGSAVGAGTRTPAGSGESGDSAVPRGPVGPVGAAGVVRAAGAVDSGGSGDTSVPGASSGSAGSSTGAVAAAKSGEAAEPGGPGEPAGLPEPAASAAPVGPVEPGPSADEPHGSAEPGDAGGPDGAVGSGAPADAGPGRRSRKRVRNYGAGRDALLDAAVRVVARGGLRKLTYRAVAQEAGVTHGLVVHHFGSRDALIEEALAHAVRSSLNSSALEPGTGRVADFSAGLSDMVESGPDLQAFQYELLLEARRRPELMPHLRALYEEYFGATRRELSQMLARPVDRGLYRLVFAALEGLVLHQLVFGEREVTEEALARLRELLGQLAVEPDEA